MMNHTFWNEGVVYSPGIQGQEFMPRGLSTRWVKADMILGNAHAGCRGAGICKISVQGRRSALSRCGCECIPILLTHVNKDCIQLIIDKRSLNFAQRIKHFYENETAVHKIIPLPHQLRSVLGYQTNIGIDVQNIEIHEDKYCYHCLVNVSRINK